MAESGETSQTLDRGLSVLTVLADSDRPLTPAELAKEMGLSRAIVYRLVNTLARRKLVAAVGDGSYRIGTGVLDLTRRIAPDLQQAAAGEMGRLAEEFAATSILVVADGTEAVCLATVEPPGPHVRLRYPPGFRNPLHFTASGMAILAGRPPVPGEREEITRARERGYAMSFGDIQATPGVAVAAPILAGAAPAEASIAVASLDQGGLEESRVAPRVLEAAGVVAGALC